MTPEREKEIRFGTCPSACVECEIQRDLLSEIDALRAELQTALIMAEANMRLSKERQKERDHLKAENEKLRLFLNPMTDESIRIKAENQKLRERIEKLRERHKRIDILDYEWDFKQEGLKQAANISREALTQDDEAAR